MTDWMYLVSFRLSNGDVSSAVAYYCVFLVAWTIGICT